MDETSYGIRLAVGALATWRLTRLLSSEDGPTDIVIRVRVRLGHSLAGSPMDCIACLSLWIAAPAALFISKGWVAWVFDWLALSGAACLLERLIPEPEIMQPPLEQTEGDSLCVAVKSERR